MGRSRKSGSPARLVFSSSANRRGESVIPFRGTRGRLRFGAASLLVVMAVHILLRENQVFSCIGLLCLFLPGVRKLCVSTHYPRSPLQLTSTEPTAK